MNRQRDRGFTLIELMITLAIIGILAMLVIPSYNDSVTKARRTDGKSALLDVMAKQERFFTEQNTYTTNLALLPANSTSAEGFYTVTAAACGTGIASCVTLTATPGTAQSADGALTLDSRGVKGPANKW